MSQADEINRQVSEFFSKLQSDLLIDDIKALDALLPDDPAVLTGLSARCVEESRKALRAGQHMEGRRLDILGRQLQARAGKLNPG